MVCPGNGQGATIGMGCLNREGSIREGWMLGDEVILVVVVVFFSIKRVGGRGRGRGRVRGGRTDWLVAMV